MAPSLAVPIAVRKEVVHKEVVHKKQELNPTKYVHNDDARLS